MALTPQQQAQIDALGQAWMTAKTQEEKDSLHNQANILRNQAGMVAGTDYHADSGAALMPGMPAGFQMPKLAPQYQAMAGQPPSPTFSTTSTSQQPTGAPVQTTSTPTPPPTTPVGMPTGSYKQTISGKTDAQLIADVIKAMQANSGNWGAANDVGKAALHAQNDALGKAIGAVYDAPSGTWRLNGVSINDVAKMDPSVYGGMFGGTDYIQNSQQVMQNPNGSMTGSVFDAFMQLMNQNSAAQQAQQAAWQKQAQQQAQTIANQKKNSLNDLINSLKGRQQSAFMGVKGGIADAQTALDDTTFQNWMAARQGMANRGLAGSGIASDQDTRLLMSKQRDLNGIYRDAARQSFDIENQIGGQLDTAYRGLSEIDPNAIADAQFQKLYSQGKSGINDQAKIFADLLGTIMPYDMATLKDQMGFQIDKGQLGLDQQKNSSQNQIEWAKVDLERWKTLGYMPDPTSGKLVPTAGTSQALRQQALEEAKARGYFVNSDGSITPTEQRRNNQADESIRGQELIARMSQWAQENQLSSGRLNLDAAQFQHKMDYDQTMLEKAGSELSLSKDKTQLEALKANLSGIDEQINRYISQGLGDPRSVPENLMTQRNQIINSIDQLFRSAPKTNGGAGIPSSLFSGFNPSSSGGSSSGAGPALKKNPVGQLGTYKTWIDQGAKTAGVQPNVIYNMMIAESGGDASAIGPMTSYGTAKGLMQFIDSTAQGFGIDPMDPQQAITGAIKYMKDLLNMWGNDYRKAVASYNWGEGNVQRAIRNYGENWEAHAPAETKGYLKNVLGR